MTDRNYNLIKSPITYFYSRSDEQWSFGIHKIIYAYGTTSAKSIADTSDPGYEDFNGTRSISTFSTRDS